MTRETVKQVSVEVRRSITSLQRTPQPLRSIQKLLSDLPEKISWVDKPPTDFVFEFQDPLYLPQEQGDQVLFIVQEALLNAYRHAHAKQITLTLESQGQDICISVQDNGIGFEQRAWWETSPNHFGMGVMHSRAARIGAILQIDSSIGNGTCVTLTLPRAGGNNRPIITEHAPAITVQKPIRQGITE